MHPCIPTTYLGDGRVFCLHILHKLFEMKSQSFTGTLAKIAKDAFASLLIAAVMVMVIAKDWK